MTANKNIRKILFVAVWVLFGTGVLVLLLAAAKSKNKMICNGLNIEINNSESGVWFVDKSEVAEVITSNGNYTVKGRLMQEFNLKLLEERLEKNRWILDAELYFDNNNDLQVEILERDPIARIFTNHGNSFYIDSAMVKLPLSDKMSVKLPVFTGFPSELTRKTRADSLLLSDIKKLSNYIRRDRFWMAQITQIHITPNREFELVPMVGNHIIEFGKADDIAKKFDRLMVFYKEVFVKTGMEQYDIVKVQYDNQVVGVRNPKYINKSDSIRITRDIENLIASTYDDPLPIEEDSVISNKQLTEASPPKRIPSPVKSTTATNPTVRSNPAKPAAPKFKPVENLKEKVPKAVMPAKE